MKSKWRMPHPATMFLLLTMAVVFLSWICDIYGLKVTLPQSGEDIRVQSLLSPEGIRWWLRNAIKNFTGFAPLGMVIIAMFGLGVAQHSGFIDACIRLGVGNRKEKRKVILWVIVLGLLSNVIGDGGYIILLPIAAMLFQWVGLHPIAGIVTAYVSVACGYSANIVLSTMDPLLAHTTQEAALTLMGYQGNTEPLCNYFFMSASTVVITGIVYWVTQKWLLPNLGKYEGSVKVEAYRPLSRKERRALMVAVTVAGIYVALILWLTFSSYGILRGVNGGLMHSPFIAGILFLLSLGAGFTGMAYGFSSGRYRSDNDVIEGLIYAVGCHKPLINIANVEPVTVLHFANLVNYYKSVDIELVGEKREFDNLEQQVNQDIYLVPLSYMPVERGIEKVFARRRKEDPQKNAEAEK